MSTLDDRLQTSLSRTQHRLGIARYRRRRQKRLIAMWGAGLLIVAGLLVFRRGGPAAPSPVLTWPDKQGALLRSGATFWAKRGEAFEVGVDNADLSNLSWRLRWQAGESQGEGESFKWLPTVNGPNSSATLRAVCKPQGQGAAKLLSWMWPSREVYLRAIGGEAVDERRFRVVPPTGGAWLAREVRAEAPVVFDERALSLLQKTSALVPPLPRESPDASFARTLWTLQSAFDAKSKGDGATYARFSPSAGVTPELMAKIARKIAQDAPDASIKFVVRLPQKPPEGVLRLAFDGKAERAAWVKRTPDGAGEPFEWWKEPSEEPNKIDKPLAQR